MSGSRPTAVEQHLGDRLAALVDGELGHDARERVLAHLATCPKCKAEADAQRRLKSVFAEVAPPPPSESFLARLQGLPAGGDDEGEPPLMPGGPPSHARREGFAGPGVFGMTAEHALHTPEPPRPRHTPFGYSPAGPHAPVLPGGGEHTSVLPGGEHGFRIHDVSRQEAERSASRGRRFAFVAAGAVSLAAIALGGVTAGVPTTTTGSPGSTPSNATPIRTAGPAASADAVRRRSGGSQAVRSTWAGGALPAPVTPLAASAPLLPGMPTPPRAPDSPSGALTAVQPGAAPLAPLIRSLPAAGDTAANSVPDDTAEPSAGAMPTTVSIGATAPWRR